MGLWIGFFFSLITFPHVCLGLQHEGIFRVSGSQVEVNDIKNAFERGKETALKMRPNVYQPPGVLRYLFCFERSSELNRQAGLALQLGNWSPMPHPPHPHPRLGYTRMARHIPAPSFPFSPTLSASLIRVICQNPKVNYDIWAVYSFIRNSWWQLISKLMRLFIVAHLLSCGLLR